MLPSRNDYDKRDAVITLFNAYVAKVNRMRRQLRVADEDEKECIYQDVSLCHEAFSKVIWEKIVKPSVLRLVLQDLADKNRTEWIIYAILLETKHPFLMQLLEESTENRPRLEESPWGDIDILGFSFTKK